MLLNRKKSWKNRFSRKEHLNLSIINATLNTYRLWIDSNSSKNQSRTRHKFLKLDHFKTISSKMYLAMKNLS